MANVLIVDDAAFMRAALKQILEQDGVNVIGEAENGYEAISKYEELSPDLITMDITMPKMNGIDAIKEIKKINPKAKIIVVSALGQEKMILDCVNCGAISFIVKPFKSDMVKNMVKKVLNLN